MICHECSHVGPVHIVLLVGYDNDPQATADAIAECAELGIDWYVVECAECGAQGYAGEGFTPLERAR